VIHELADFISRHSPLNQIQPSHDITLRPTRRCIGQHHNLWYDGTSC